MTSKYEIRRICIFVLTLALLACLFTVYSSDEAQIEDLTPTLENSRFCQGKSNITTALNALLMKLLVEGQVWNGTADAAKAQATAVLAQYLDVESEFRLAQDTEQKSLQAAEYDMNKLKELKEEKKYQESVVAKKSSEYPVKKAEINSERQLILLLIKMVESIGQGDDSKSDPDAQGALKTLQSDENLFQLVGSGFAKSRASEAARQLVSGALGRLRALERRGHEELLAGRPTASEIQETRASVKAVLEELLQDPAFREFLLDTGLDTAVENLMTLNHDIVEREESVSSLYARADQARATMADTSLDRAKSEGASAVAKHTESTLQSAAKAASPSVARQVRLLRALIGGIDGYCRTGVFALAWP